MKLPELNVEELARLRMKECQGTLLGGLKVAQGLGLSAEEFGYRMMMEQIAHIFYEHYQVTYGFGSDLSVAVQGDTLRFEMPPLARAAAGQLQHWRLSAQVLEDVNRGFWRALNENAGITASLEFTPDRHTVTVRRG
jgi:hypothetical protein